MQYRFVATVLLFTLLMSHPAAAESEKCLMKAFYTPVKGTDPEYGQVAIEKNELPHREIRRFVWLIQVPEPPDPAHWQEKLNAAVDPKHGSFRVTLASAEEEKRVKSKEITLQQ